jgi:hypothetical protein
MNYFDVNSPLLSDLKHLIFRSVSFSTIYLNILKHSNASDFFLRKKTVIIIVKSSISSIKYCSPFIPFVLIGPHRSMCTISNDFTVEYSFVLNSVLVYFPCRKCFHRVLVGFEILGISLTASFLLILTRFSKFT